MMRGHPIIILIISILRIVVTYDINVTDLPQVGKSCQRGIGILLSKLFWPTVRKNCSSDLEKNLKLETEGREFAKKFRSLNRTIYSNSERSEQFLVTELLPGGFSRSTNLEQL